jgi:hypothetical protein
MARQGYFGVAMENKNKQSHVVAKGFQGMGSKRGGRHHRPNNEEDDKKQKEVERTPTTMMTTAVFTTRKTLYNQSK